MSSSLNPSGKGTVSDDTLVYTLRTAQQNKVADVIAVIPAKAGFQRSSLAAAPGRKPAGTSFAGVMIAARLKDTHFFLALYCG
jgi:hypothetical protein